MTGRPRIAIVGMSIESSAYSAHRADFRDFTVREGGALIARYPFLADGGELAAAAEWIGVFHARSIPGGRVRREVYEEFKARMVSGLGDVAGDGIDGVYLDVHGAMSVVGMDDAEGDLATAIRAVVGPEPLIASPMDLHGNLSERFVRAVDLPTCYRLAPHEDVDETRERAARTLLEWLGREQRPRRAWVRVPVLLPGEKTSTRVEPARSLYGLLAGVETMAGVTDASIWIGYAWADEPRCHATVLVSGDDPEVISAQAEALAGRLWDVRDEFDFVGPPGSLDEAVERALAHRAAGGPGPYLISDSGDNPGAGGTGDVTWTLTRLLAMPALTSPDAPLTYVASVFDTEAFAELGARRVGEPVDIVVGARVDNRVSPPVRIAGELVGLHEGDPDAGRIAVIARGGLRVIVTEYRKDFHDPADFAAIDLDPRLADIIVTKIGYLEPGLYDLAQGWTLALTPGPVDQDLQRLGHHRIRRPMFPFDEFDTTPPLRARML